MYLAPQERRIASTLDFKPGQSLMDFASKLSKKARDSPKAPLVPLSPVKVDNAFLLPPPPSSGSTGTRPSTRSQSTRSPQHCTFCGKTGHKFLHCFQRKRQAAKEASMHLSPSSGSSSAPAATSQPLSHQSVAPSKHTRVSRASQALTMQLGGGVGGICPVSSNVELVAKV